MSRFVSYLQLVDLLVRFQRTYASSVLQVGLHGNVYRTDPWEELVRGVDSTTAARALAEAGYEHACHEDGYSTGWHPVRLLRRRELDQVSDDIIDHVAALTKAIPCVPADQHNLLLAAQDNLKAAHVQVNLVKASLL
jgi:hypothetical protein